MNRPGRAADSTSLPTPRGAALVPASSWLARISALILFAGLALGLAVPKVAGGAFLLLALLGIIWLEPGLARRNWQLDAHERLLAFAVALFVGLWLLSWVVHGLGPVGFDDVGRILRLLLIVPVYLFLRRIDGLERGWWSGLVAGAVVAGVYAIGFALAGQPGEWAERVGGPTNPIYFGGIVLAFSLMLLPRAADANLSPGRRLLVAAAIVLGFVASALSGSRGAWLALPPLLVLYWFTLGSRQSAAWRNGVPLALLGVAALLAVLPGIPLGERLADAWRSLTDGRSAAAVSDTLSIRWELWRLSFQRLGDAWLSGTGPGGFRAALEAAVAEGRLPIRYLEYHHPHNQYLSAWLIAGLPGLAAFVLLIAVPARRFAMLWRSGLERTRMLGWCGLAAVSVLAVMSLSESIFQRNSGIVWFALLVAASSALVQARHRWELTRVSAPRLHSLSVIMICRNESDRIGNALESVADWADEIVVLDSGSTDDTPGICREYTDRVEVTDWPGFGIQKQRALERAGGDWVLSIDADEIVTEELKREIDLVLSRPEPHFDGYRIRWLTRAFGADLHFGHWARAPIRLVRRSRAQFTPACVHEKLVMTGPNRHTGRLEGWLLHDVFRSIEHARSKLGDYARLQAAERFEDGRRATRPGAYLRAAFNWLDNFIVRGAFLDGRVGWTMSALYARYTLDKYRELARLSRL